jgi:hypothetical protein
MCTAEADPEVLLGEHQELIAVLPLDAELAIQEYVVGALIKSRCSDALDAKTCKF